MGQEPEEDIQIYVADTTDELGLWYRLAPVSFMARSLVSPGGGISPFPAASLGSVVLHGPHTGRHTPRYERLSKSHAARLVLTGDGLGREVQNHFQPHQAAQVAQAAWSVLSETAPQADRLVEILVEELERVELN